MQMIGSAGSKGPCLHMREVVAIRRLFFFTFFKVSCASLQFGLLDRSTPLTAQTTRPVGIHITLSCKDDQQSQWEMLNFDPQTTLNPLSDRHQIWRV